MKSYEPSVKTALGTPNTDTEPQAIVSKPQTTRLVNAEVQGTLAVVSTTGTKYAEFEADGTLKFSSSGTVFEDLRVSPSSGSKPSTNPPVLKAFGPSGNIMAWSFDKTTDQQFFFEIQFPHAWKEGSTIFPHVHWSPSDTDTGNCIWKLEYSWANINGTFPAPSTITATQAGSGTAWKHQIIGFESGAGVSASGKTLSNIMMCRLYRDAATDNYNNDAFLLAFDVHYEIDTLGSRSELSK